MAEQNSVAQYKWDWNEKLGASPFRREIKRLKQDSKTKAENKSSNNEIKHGLRLKENEFLVEFQMKCDQAKIWINNAHKEYNNEYIKNEDDPKIFKQIEYQRKKEKIDVIDQFWAELICKETAYLQTEKIKKQNQTMAELEKQLKETQKKLDLINNRNNKNNENMENTVNDKKDIKTKKKKKKKKDKDEYLGLIGYFNKKNGNKNKKKQKKEHKKNAVNVNKDDVIKQNGNDEKQKIDEKPKEIQINSDKNEENKEKEIVTKETKNNENVKKTKEQKVKPKTTSSGSMKGGFLKSGTKGLYDDKKLDSELTVNERNVKNLKQIEEMGLKDATNNPFYTWERPKISERNKTEETQKQESNQNNNDKK